MLSSRYLVVCAVPFLLLSTCSENDEGGGSAGNGGDESVAGEGGRDGEGGSGGTARAGRGGSNAGQAGMDGDPGGRGGSSGRGGASNGGSATGGRAGMGGSAGTNDGGLGGEGGVVCTTVELPLPSADFDTNTAAWILYDEETGASRPIIVAGSSAGVTAESSPNVAHLGGVNNCRAGMYQTIAIPEGAQTMTLTGYRHVTTEETGSTPFDVLTIQLWENAQTTTGLAGDFAVFSNEHPTTDWLEFTGTVAVDAHGGETLDLDFWAETDSSLNTDFYVDSLVLTAEICL